MMKMSRLNLTALILASFFFGIQPAPARPLNERSKELTWQAWLLVDDQNQNKQFDPEGTNRRRITPKSVFIAPTFNPESLPACPDGYGSDAMGRCVKLIQIDEDAHLDAVLDHLRQTYGNFTDDDDYDYTDDEVKPTPGPVQFNIPLFGVDDSQKNEQETNVAIIVAPTNGNFNVSRNDSMNSDDVKKDDSVQAPIIITRISIDESEDMSTTTEQPETTTTPPEPQAIFFKLPDFVKQNQTAEIETKQPIWFQQAEHQQPPLQASNVKFRDETEQIISQLLPVANVKTTEKFLDELLQSNNGNNYGKRPHRHPSPQLALQPPKQIYNHRNRDKWLFPPAWTAL